MLWQFQVRPRSLVGEPVTIYFTKDTWVICVASPIAYDAVIESVSLRGLVFQDRSGRFSQQNLFALQHPSAQRCGGTNISVLDSNRFFVAFSHIDGIKKGDQLAWSNPLAP